MNINPIKSVLKPNNRFVCLSCLLKPSYACNWRQIRRFTPVYPTPDPSVAAALYGGRDDDQKERPRKKKKNVHKPTNKPASGIHDEGINKVKPKPAVQTVPDTKGHKITDKRQKVGKFDAKDLGANDHLADHVKGSEAAKPELKKKKKKKKKKSRPKVDNNIPIEAAESIKTNEQAQEKEADSKELTLLLPSPKTRRLRKASTKSTAERLREKVRQVQSAQKPIAKTPTQLPIRKFLSTDRRMLRVKRRLSIFRNSPPPEQLAQKLEIELAAHKASLIAKDKATQPFKGLKYKGHLLHRSVPIDTTNAKFSRFDQVTGHESLQTALLQSKEKGSDKTTQNAIEEIEAKALDISRSKLLATMCLVIHLQVNSSRRPATSGTKFIIWPRKSSFQVCNHSKPCKLSANIVIVRACTIFKIQGLESTISIRIFKTSCPSPSLISRH